MTAAGDSDSGAIRRTSSRQGLRRIVAYALLLVVPLLAAAVWQPASEGVLYQWGRNFALLGFMLLVLQPLLAARIKWIESPFGLDIVIRFHKQMALFALLLLLLHPLLLAAGGSGWRLLIGLDLPWYIYAGKVALLLLVANVILSHYQRKLGLKFETWRRLHDIVGPALIVLVFVHSWTAGHDLNLMLLKLLWAGLLLLASLLFLYHRFLRPRQLKRRAWKVSEVRKECEDVWSVKLAPPDSHPPYDYLPGQFHFITFLRGRNLPEEEHHWTISSSPAQGSAVSSTIKALGDFTATIGDTRPGDRAAVHGAFGRFSYLLHPGERDLVFLAGGIGITPLMSMLRHMRDSRDTRKVLLLYANRDASQVVFKEELARIEESRFPALKVVHVISSAPADWPGERGRLDQEKIERLCGPDLSPKTFYVCGPPAMSKAVIAALKELGAADGQIRQEIFSFLE
jgi:predicted ferric reductase